MLLYPRDAGNTLVWHRKDCYCFDNYTRGSNTIVRWHLMDTIHEAESWLLSSSVPRSYGENPHYIRAVRLVLVCKSHCVQTKFTVESLCCGGIRALAEAGWWRGGQLLWFSPSVHSRQPCCAGLE